MRKERIFILDSEKAYKMAEKFKENLENEGYRVETKSYGLHGVRITGIKDMEENEVYSDRVFGDFSI